jgi:amino acid permease
LDQVSIIVNKVKGVLALPGVFRNSGWFFGLLMIVMGAISCAWSNYMLVQRARHHNLFNYSEITEKAGGPLLTRIL